MSNGKGDKWRGGWNKKYEDNFNRIFGEKKVSRVEAKLYLQMWLSEQIPTDEWLRILNERPDIAKLYAKHLKEKNHE